MNFRIPKKSSQQTLTKGSYGVEVESGEGERVTQNRTRNLMLHKKYTSQGMNKKNGKQKNNVDFKETTFFGKG